MNRIANLLLASALAASMTIPAASASAQDSHRDRNDQYEAGQAAYNAQVRDYNAARDQYDRDRAAYDRRYGPGSFERTNGDFNRNSPPPPRPYVDTTATLPPSARESAACADARARLQSRGRRPSQ